MPNLKFALMVCRGRRLNLLLLTLLMMPFVDRCVLRFCPWEVKSKNPVHGFTFPGNHSCATMIKQFESESFDVDYFDRLCRSRYINGRLIHWRPTWPRDYLSDRSVIRGHFPDQFYWYTYALNVEKLSAEDHQTGGTRLTMRIEYPTGEVLNCTYVTHSPSGYKIHGKATMVNTTKVKLITDNVDCDIVDENVYHDTYTLELKYTKYYVFGARGRWLMGKLVPKDMNHVKRHNPLGLWCVHDKGKFIAVNGQTHGSYRCAGNEVLPFCQHTNLSSCVGHSCAQNSTCIIPTEGNGKRRCNCSFGLDDLRCYKTPKLKPCDRNPCGLFTKCENLKNGYICKCKDGTERVHCPEVTVDCRKNNDIISCTPTGRCEHYNGSHFCTCEYDMGDRRCYKSSPCLSNPCGNDGTCMNDGSGYICECKNGIRGRTCTEVHPHCLDHACTAEAYCVPTKKGHICSCPDGFANPKCYAKSKNPCRNNPCGEYGNCEVQYDSFTWKCHCQPGRTGATCEKDLNECDSNPCYENSICINGNNEFKCSCALGFTGRLCNQNIDDCVGNPCRNGGTCYDGIHDYSCRCVSGYTGKSCETDIDECASSPCMNDGTCIDLLDKFECECVKPFKQPTCSDKELTLCDLKPCRNGGTCTTDGSDYKCTCTEEYAGSKCEIKRFFCTTMSCNHGHCVQGSIDFSCQCKEGFTGLSCSEDVDECMTENCENGGTCLDEVNGISCQCPDEWKGSRCEEEINNCLLEQCEHNGTCMKRTGECKCSAGFSGPFCEHYKGAQESSAKVGLVTLLIIGISTAFAVVILSGTLFFIFGQKKRATRSHRSRRHQRAASVSLSMSETSEKTSQRRRWKWRSSKRSTSSYYASKQARKSASAGGSSYSVPNR